MDGVVLTLLRARNFWWRARKRVGNARLGMGMAVTDRQPLYCGGERDGAKRVLWYNSGLLSHFWPV